MITPAPTTKIDPALCRGTVLRQLPATATRPAFTVVTFPNTSYELHLEPAKLTPATALPEGAKVVGVIKADANRIDVVQTGGRYVEPVAGRPRRVQGMVVAIEDGRLVVDAGVPIHISPADPRQKASDFQPGDFVSFDVHRGATLETR